MTSYFGDLDLEALAIKVAKNQLQLCPCYGHLCGRCDESRELIIRCLPKDVDWQKQQDLKDSRKEKI